MNLKKTDYILFILNLVLAILNIGRSAYFFGMGDNKHFIFCLGIGVFNLIVGLLCLWASKLVN